MKPLQHITVILLIAISLLFNRTQAAYLPIEWMNDPARIDSVSIVPVKYQLLIDLEDLANRLDIDGQRDRGEKHVRLDMPANILIFSTGTPFVLAGNELRQMPLQIIKRNNRFLAPLAPLIILLSEFYPGELLYDPSAPKLLVAPPRHDLFGFRYDIELGRTRVLIPAVKLLECRDKVARDGSINLFFERGTIDVTTFNNIPVEGLVVKLSAVQTSKGALINLKPRSETTFKGVEIITDPPLYCVEFECAIEGGLDPDAKRKLDAERDAWALDVVVIDPGHGGKDPGAIGPTGLYEKDVVLDVGLKLSKVLEKKGIKTIMTRDRDVLIPLDERGRIANRSGGKVFISLHCNALMNRTAYGIETYFLAPAKTERAMQVAMKENSVIRFEESQEQYQDLTEENFILLTMAQANFGRESERLAAMVQKEASIGLSLNDRGVDQAGFYVLIGASMPAILVEMAFISTKSEEKKLRKKKFRQQLADEICDAVLLFFKQSR